MMEPVLNFQNMIYDLFVRFPLRDWPNFKLERENP